MLHLRLFVKNKPKRYKQNLMMDAIKYKCNVVISLTFFSFIKKTYFLFSAFDASLDPNLCEPASCNQKTGDQKKKKNNITIHVASVAVILVPLVLASAAAIIFFLHKRKHLVNFFLFR
jgi:hypothetical protein